ncbi:MAG: NAD-glutamate dehydrogenase [Gemmatimonadetes bacterium]|nr:NAD-glutamate dehydrogenase [Gemmatimonadota bacterium]
MTTTPIDLAGSPLALAGTALADDLCGLLAESDAENASLLCAFAREFFTRVPRHLADERSIDDVAALTAGAFRFLQDARAGLSVQVVDPEEEGWEASVTVIRAVVDDRPFVVDSVREYLSAENLAIRNFIHPIVGVERDEAGEIVRIGDSTEGTAEALVHIELARIDDPARKEQIRAEVERRLGDVVAATDDFEAMLRALADTVAMLGEFEDEFPDRSDEVEEVANFLRWLQDGHFVFLGSRSYRISHGKRPTIEVERGTGLGILRDEESSSWARPVPLSQIEEGVRTRVTSGPLLIVSKSNAESTVHRRGRMDYIGVKVLDERGRVSGERRFLGLFTSKAYAERAEAIPILREKLQQILDSSGAPPGSHDYKEIITIFNSMPKEELLQASTAELEREVQTVLSLIFTNQVRVTLRLDPLGRGVSVMVILPRGRFSGEVRQRIQEALTARFQGEVLNYFLAMSAGDQARLHFYLSARPETLEAPSHEAIENEIRQIIRSWDDRLLDELVHTAGETEAHRLLPIYAPAFNEEYRAANAPDEAVHDVLELERLKADGGAVSIALFEARGREEAIHGAMELKLYLSGERLVLSDFMPVLDNSGLRVVEVAPFTVSGPQLPDVMIYSFAVQNPEGERIPTDRAELLSEALLAIREGDAASDPFNALVLTAGLRWREVDVLRAYANYAFQIGAVPTRTGVARALARYPLLARLTLELFSARLDPGLQSPVASLQSSSSKAGLATGNRQLETSVSELRSSIAVELEKVTTLADDRALRRIVNLVEGTTRTNYFRHGGADPVGRSGGVPYISLKIRCADIEELRKSRLLYEVFVFSARMEGIHLRAAPISRGGIRWSDRPDDYRIEVLGLVQTQIVKNAVIVPSGSKGGFITKRVLPERDAMMKEMEAQLPHVHQRAARPHRRPAGRSGRPAAAGRAPRRRRHLPRRRRRQGHRDVLRHRQRARGGVRLLARRRLRFRRVVRL